MSDAVLIAVIGAIFNAGMVWGTIKALLLRIDGAEKSTVRAHQRIDELRNNP